MPQNDHIPALLLVNHDFAYIVTDCQVSCPRFCLNTLTLGFYSELMEFKEIVSISGMGGLFSMGAQKSDGMIVTSLTEGYTKFVSSRKHLFTPLENIAIYTDTDSVELKEVMLTMRRKLEELPVPSPKDNAEKYKNYLEAILPDYDRERVYVSDMKKLVKWFNLLNEKGVIQYELDQAANEAGEATESESEEATEAS